LHDKQGIKKEKKKEEGKTDFKALSVDALNSV